LVEEKLTDPKTEPIHETKQQPPNKAQLFDNVYSGKPAESPVKTPIPEPTTQRIQDFRQALANWFRVEVSFQLSLWLLTFLLMRRWNIRAFFRDIDQHHTPRLFRSQEAAWRFMVADYQARGPTLDAIPPEKRIVQPLAPNERPAISIQLSAESPPPESPPVESDQQSAVSIQPSKVIPRPPMPGERVSYERMDELLDQHGVPNAKWYDWMNDVSQRSKRWPRTEEQALGLIDRYCASLDRNRSIASSDAASIIRASSDVSGTGGGAGGSPGG
jgi:hypothetical protein